VQPGTVGKEEEEEEEEEEEGERKSPKREEKCAHVSIPSKKKKTFHTSSTPT
jgi:hypothetical protein